MIFSRLASLAGAAYLLSAIPCISPVHAQTPHAATAPLSAAQEGALKAGDKLQECAKCPVMLVVPAGSFIMGSPANEPDRHSNEGPQHKVTIATQFAVGQYEVTFNQWDACVAAGGCDDYKPSDAGWGRRTRPVINVSRNNANAYVAWLTKKTGKPYRLLSESEYEYATRAGNTSTYPWGDDIKLKGQPMADCTDCGSRWEMQRAPVGSFPPNRFGLYDMVGNASEWTEDCYHPDYNGARRMARPGPANAPISPSLVHLTPEKLSDML
jgi:formylglycine-generating enzyme required for sulfatase activity